MKQIKVQLGSFIFPINPESVKVSFSRKIAQIEVPGRNGDIIQDLGSRSKEIEFSGSLMTSRQFGPSFDSDWQQLRILKEFENKDNVILDLNFPIKMDSFDSQSIKVSIKSVEFTDVAGRYDWKSYTITCVEWLQVEIKQNLVILGNEDALKRLKDINEKKAYGFN